MKRKLLPQTQAVSCQPSNGGFWAALLTPCAPEPAPPPPPFWFVQVAQNAGDKLPGGRKQRKITLHTKRPAFQEIKNKKVSKNAIRKRLQIGNELKAWLAKEKSLSWQ